MRRKKGTSLQPAACAAAIRAAACPERIAPSIVAGKPVCT